MEAGRRLHWREGFGLPHYCVGLAAGIPLCGEGQSAGWPRSLFVCGRPLAATPKYHT